jgi:ATP-dependent helicase/nuclease subunit A
MTLADASERQRQAADPAISVWLTANAGSGKTRVLIDRVARLLLRGTEPVRILCLTYTTAAATEMQNRLFAELGAWAMLDDAALAEKLKALGAGDRAGHRVLARARRLFATAIETPGGLKIQTIHAFCASVLRRFPLEAGVSPAFRELDEQTARALRAEVLEELADQPDRETFDGVARLLSASTDELLSAIASGAEALAFPPGRDEVFRRHGVPLQSNSDSILKDVLLPGDLAMQAELIPHLTASGPRDKAIARRLQSALEWGDDARALPMLEDAFLTGADAKSPFSAKVGAVPTKAVRSGAGKPFAKQLDALMERIALARPRRIALAAAERTSALHDFAPAFLAAYDARKAALGVLDFDDLIRRTAALLSDASVAAWVLYRLDGGLDHVLVDEAQDTSPAQWRVIRSLVSEFSTGEGARPAERTLFVVGDKKQSIYSFQGADLATFDATEAALREDFRNSAAPIQPLVLDHSFRSAPAILRVVDQTFAQLNERDCDLLTSAMGGAPQHKAIDDTRPGRVDLWPCVENVKGTPSDEGVQEDHASVVLAERVADEIRRLIDAGTPIPMRDGTTELLHEGHIMILVRGRKTDLFGALLRSCKARGLAVAGADRMRLGAEVAVRDIRALLSFLSLPEDDLSLAEVLRSPLLGLTEDDLFRIASGRGEGTFLWQALREKASAYPEAVAKLQDLLDRADFLRPYDLIERVLARHRGREALLARLGAEAEEGIDALLARALRFEAEEIPDLTTFLNRLQADEEEIKRQPDGAQRALRIMTVHGAKGLEAPVVILPDAADRNGSGGAGGPVALTDDGLAIWRTRKDDAAVIQTAADAARKRRDDEERLRLLYVAMTRAESWLIVAAAGSAGPESWHSLVRSGLLASGAAPREAAGGDSSECLRHESGRWPGLVPEHARPRKGAVAADPVWLHREAGPAAWPPKPLSPSDLGGAKALPGEAGQDEDAAKRYGTLLHRLLEHLRGQPVAVRKDLAEGLIAPGELPPGTTRDSILADAERVLSSPGLADLFGPGALAEVEVTATLPDLSGRIVQGVIDLLVVGPDRVLAVDYKSNAVVPERPADVPDGILRQMGAYEAALSRIYPDRRVEVAVLWTRTASLMPLPLDMVRSALQRSTIP